MFNDTFAKINTLKVRVKDPRQSDLNHVAEVEFEIPLTYELADSILPAMARDLYERNGSEWVPKPEIEDATFAVKADPQLLTIKQHPELAPVVKIGQVTLRRFMAKKGESELLFLMILANWVVGDYEKELIEIIKRLKQGVYLISEDQQPELLDTGIPDEQQGADAHVDSGGNVESIRKPRRSRKHGPTVN